MVTSEQLRAARALLRWEQKDIAAASKVSLPTIKRLETIRGDLAAQVRTVEAIRAALEKAEVPENLSMVDLGYVVPGLQGLIHKGRIIRGEVRLCGAAGRVKFLDSVR